MSATPEHIRTLVYRMQHLMYGNNYEVSFGIEVLENCFTLKEANKAIRNIFNEANPQMVAALPVCVDDFWTAINETFAFRSDG